MGKKLRNIASYAWRYNIAVLIILFILVVGFIDNNSLVKKIEIKNENSRLRAEIAEYERQCHNDSLKLQQLKESPNAVIKVAREVHLMKADDEDVYLVSVETPEENAEVE